jgi:hypothetical protein
MALTTIAILPYRSPKPYIRLVPKEAKKMTVCIAAITKEKYIVTASDRMVSGEISSDNCMTKSEQFHEDWSALISGDLASYAPILQRAKILLAQQENTLANASASLLRAFKEQLAQNAGDRVLGRFGMTMQDFLTKGKKQFRLEEHMSLWQEINAERLNCDFLAFGFDRDKTPHIFRVCEPGILEVYDKLGFWAIGSGEIAAKTMLYYYGQNVDARLPESLYRVITAKFMAERAPGVGKDTSLYVSKHGCFAFSQPYMLLHEIRASWEEKGKPQPSPDIIPKLEADCKTRISFFRHTEEGVVVEKALE